MKEKLEKEGYILVREIEGRGWCGIMPFLFTFGLCYGLDDTGYRGRWCYTTGVEAAVRLAEWDGVGDPSGNWIKYKGEGGERSNENN